MKAFSEFDEHSAVDHSCNSESPTGDTDLIGYAEAAQLLNTPIGTLYGWVNRKRVPHIRISKRLVKFSRRALATWIAERTVQPVE